MTALAIIERMMTILKSFRQGNNKVFGCFVKYRHVVTLTRATLAAPRITRSDNDFIEKNLICVKAIREANN